MAKKPAPKKKAVQPNVRNGALNLEPTTKRKGLPTQSVFYLICAIVVAAGLLVYVPSLNNGFTNWDDPGYLTQNYEIRNWSQQGVSHLFKSYAMGNYHPLTMLSLAFEYHADMLKPYIYHRDSLVLHILASLAVTVFTWLLTRKSGITAICGILFVIHPMHVESVAWVAGRKDVLFGLFYFLALICYLYYARAKSKGILPYSLMMVCFVLALLSKAVAVTLPISCLLIDLYLKRPLKLNVLIEKIPLFLLSIIFGIISIQAQKSAEAIQSPDVFPLFDRIFFASYGFLAYIGKLLVPSDLANFYPYPDHKTGLPALWYILPFVIVAICFVIYRFGRKNIDLVFGFLFFSTAIFLLLQLIPVGTAIIADRYTYIAYFGLFFILGSFYEGSNKGTNARIKSIKPVLPFLFLGWFLYLGYTARARTEVWKSTETLWRDEIEKQPEEGSAYNNLGFELFAQEKYDEALPLFSKSIMLMPEFVHPYTNRGEIYRRQGKFDLAIRDFNKAIQLKDNDPAPYLSRAILYCIKSKLDSAGLDFNKSISLDPNNAEAYCSRGNYYDMRNKSDSAMADYNKAIGMKPDLTDAYINRGSLKIKKGDYQAAIADIDLYLQMKPDAAMGFAKRSEAWVGLNNYKNALVDAEKAKQLGFEVRPEYLDNLRTRIK